MKFQSSAWGGMFGRRREEPELSERAPTLAKTSRYRLRGCPRCEGDLYWDQTEYICFQCGARV